MEIYSGWFHKNIIFKDKTIEGWKNWANSIVEGANKPGNEEFSRCYHDILTHGDLYPNDFLKWLDKEMGLSAKKFPIPSKKN